MTFRTAAFAAATLLLAARAAAQDAKAPQFYGFINVQASQVDAPTPASNSSTLELRRARIGARGDVTPNIGYVVLFDAADVSVKDAFVSLKNVSVLPGLELRAGQWKTPFGYEQPESDTKLLWVNGSYVVQALARSTTTTSLTASSDARDVGVGIVGKWKLSGPLGAELAASVVNGAGPSRRDDLNEKNVWGRAGATFKRGTLAVRAGGSYGYGHQLAGLGANAKFDGVGTPVDDTSFHFLTYGADVTVDTPWFFLASEIIQSERDVWNHATGERPNVLARGWYAGVYGKTPWNVGPVFRAERYDRNGSMGADANERYTVGAYADVLPINARLIFDYELDESDAAVRTGNRAVLFAQVIF
jgi:hypothetical protein